MQKLDGNSILWTVLSQVLEDNLKPNDHHELYVKSIKLLLLIDFQKFDLSVKWYFFGTVNNNKLN